MLLVFSDMHMFCLMEGEFEDQVLEGFARENVEGISAAQPMPAEVRFCRALTIKGGMIEFLDHAILRVGNVVIEGLVYTLGAIHIAILEAEIIEMRKPFRDLILQRGILIKVYARCTELRNVQRSADLTHGMLYDIGVEMASLASEEGEGTLGGVALIGDQFAAKLENAAIHLHGRIRRGLLHIDGVIIKAERLCKRIISR